MTGYYLSKSFELNSTVIDFSHFEQRHFSENIVNVIYEKLDRLNVLDRLTAVTCDSASNMKKAFETLGTVDRLWCLGHRLHLIVTNDTPVIDPIDGDSNIDSKEILDDENDGLTVNDDDDETEMVRFSISDSIRQMWGRVRFEFSS
jgi:hypothetical protein